MAGVWPFAVSASFHPDKSPRNRYTKTLHKQNALWLPREKTQVLVRIKSEPLILAIETATRAGSVALARGTEILCSASGDASASHSTDLIQTVESILKSGGVKLSDVDLFAAAVGPGSFTGLRIGLATIKSFAVCTGKSCAGVSTLAAIAHAAGASEHTVSLLPAGRGELFAQMFSVGDGQVRELDTAAHLSPNAILERYGERVSWCGPAKALMYTRKLCERGPRPGTYR